MKAPVITIAALSAALCICPHLGRPQAQVAPVGGLSPDSRNRTWDDCTRRPTRACILDEATESARSIAPLWDRYLVFRTIARAQRGAGLTNAAASSLAAAETILETERLRARRDASPESLALIALEQIEIGSVQSALRSLDDALRIAVPHGGRQSRAYRLAGEAYVTLGRTGEAARTFGLALEAAPSERNPVLRASALRLLAEAHIRSSIGGAALVLDKALSAAQEIGNARTRAWELAKIAALEAKSTPSRDAKGTFEQALQAALTVEHPIERTDTLIRVSHEQMDAGMVSDAGSTVKHSSELAQAITDPALRLSCLRQVGKELARLGLLREAADAFDAALETAKAEGFASEILTISAAQAGAKMLTEAVASYRASPSSLDEAMLRSKQSPFIPYSPARLQDSYTRSRSGLLRTFAAERSEAGQPGEAEQYFGEALQIARAIADPKERGTEIRQIAKALSAAGLESIGVMSESLAAFELAVRNAEALPSDSARGDQVRGVDAMLQGLAELLARAGQPVEARNALKLAHRATILFKDRAGRENGKRFVAVAQAKIGDIQSALSLAMSIEAPEARTRALISISEALPN